MNLDSVFQQIGHFLGVEEGLSTVEGLRELLDGFAVLLNDDLPAVGAFHGGVPYRQVDGAELTLDVIVPQGQGPFPVLVYFHGGAWIWGSPASHRKLTCRLAEQGFLTLSVDYRLAPENPFPAAFNDCIHAVHFAAKNAPRWEGDPDRLVLAGDSAGANLAAATAIELATTVGSPRVCAVGLAYGVFDFAGFESDGVTRLLTEAYLGEQSRKLAKDPRVSPILKAARLPPAHIVVGSADPLVEDAQALRSALAKAGSVHELQVYEDMPHAFMQMELLPDARLSVRRMADFLRAHLGIT